jgi:hypothetical protein
MQADDIWTTGNLLLLEATPRRLVCAASGRLVVYTRALPDKADLIVYVTVARFPSVGRRNDAAERRRQLRDELAARPTTGGWKPVGNDSPAVRRAGG